MIIGIPKEIKKNEFRVASTPDDVKELVRRGNQVYVEYSAGAGSGFSDQDYAEAGAIVLDVDEVYGKAEMIYKVKEIFPQEYKYMRDGLIVFTYLHTNAYLEMTKALLEKNVVGIAYEDIIDDNGDFPLLKPMSEIAGKGGFIAALNLSQSINGGNGLLLNHQTGIKKPVVTVIGAGCSGFAAADLAARFDNIVNVLDVDVEQLEKVKYDLPANVNALYSNRKNLEDCLATSDVIINCILWNKTRKDHLINREDLKLMKKNCIIVDVACDEGGAIETCVSTSHDDPIYEVDGIVHYCVDNIPSAFSKTASESLSSTTLPYAVEIARKGYEKALMENSGMRRGLSCYYGKLTLEETALKHNLEFTRPETALEI